MGDGMSQSVENMTPSQVLEALRKFFTDFDAMQDSIGERRFEMYRAGRELGSVAAAYELLRERQK
jgi:hypothetical protein